MTTKLKKFTLCLVAVVMMLGLVPAKAHADNEPLIDEDELNAIITEYLEEHSLSNAELGIGFCYTETGEEYYYNPDIWLYSASLYKVPLSMVYTEKVRNGEMTFEDTVGGYQLEKIVDGALVYSNNDYAILAMDGLGGEQAGREMFKALVPALDEEYYDPQFLGISSFSPRFMTNVMMTLYYESERFPTVIDRLLISEPPMYFRPTLGDDYEIAQKYGAYEEYNHASAIIYTPHPIIITVMTRYVGNYSLIIGSIGKLIADYALTLDEKYDARLAAEAAEAAAAAAVEETPEPTPEPTQEAVKTEVNEPEVPAAVAAPEAPQTVPAANHEAARPAAIIALSVVTALLVLIFIIRYIIKKRA